MRNRIAAFLLLLLWVASSGILTAQSAKKKFTFENVMKFQSHSDVSLSSKGNFLGFDFWPDRGDGEVRIIDTNKPLESLIVIELGKNATFSEDESYVAVQLKPSIYLTDAPNKPKSKKYFDSLAVYSLKTGNRVWFTDSLKAFAFSADGSHLAVHKQAKSFKDVDKTFGSQLILYSLEKEVAKSYDWVQSMSMDSTGTHLILSIADTSGMENKLLHIDLKKDYAEYTIASGNDHFFDGLTWHFPSNKLAFAQAKAIHKKAHTEASVHIYEANKKNLNTLDIKTVDGYKTPLDQNMDWSKDGDRLFFGVQPDWIFNAVNAHESEKDTTLDVYDMNEILNGKTVDVWHTEDPMIKTHEKKQWRSTTRARLQFVYHVKKKQLAVLGEEDKMLSVQISDQSNRLLASHNDPYMQERTWDGWYSDRYFVDLRTGDETKIAERHSGDIELSPSGNRVVFYQDSSWHAVKVNNKSLLTLNIDHGTDAKFYDEDHDYPSQVPSYGFAAWVGENQAIVYDKYDLLLINLDNAQVTNLTQADGRSREITYRILTDSRDPLVLSEIKNLKLVGYNQDQKSYGLYILEKGNSVPKKIFHEDKKWSMVAKAKDSDRWIFTREDYHEYPDFYRIDEQNLAKQIRLTNLHPEVDDYAWGRSELVEWTNLDGDKMQGVVIKPGNYEEGKQYPVLVYYYRFFSQRLHEFNIPRVNHRPAFPLWASDDYLIFLPDIHFEVGTPGPSSVRSLVPGIQKIIELGYADPENIGLHGHSWSGYQTAHIVTETDIFKAAIAGAPVSNMTSAYGGIRWGSGLSRAFQYEKTQSRLGVSMWDNLQPYIENSPVFFADRINTPMLIIHGDDDGAVPWYQSIEMYIALRRLGKEAVFLQYHGEDHHPAKYPNKLDWAVKMKQYFDHYLKGKPAADWISKGVRYEGK